MYSRSKYENKGKGSNLRGAFTEFFLNLGTIRRIMGYKIKLKRIISLFYVKKKKNTANSQNLNCAITAFSLMSEMNYACNLHFSMCKVTVIPTSTSALTAKSQLQKYTHRRLGLCPALTTVPPPLIWQKSPNEKKII